MAANRLSIPAAFEQQLRYKDFVDDRTDAEILQSLKQHQEITSEKNIFAFWDKGLDAMPDWCVRNVIAWFRINSASGWTVRVLNALPESPNYALKFVPAEMLPQAFVDGKMDGPYVGPHSADFLRPALTYLYGGVFMDVGIILIRDIDRICWKQLEDPSSPYQVAVPWM
jgi:hypothetical protein